MKMAQYRKFSSSTQPVLVECHECCFSRAEIGGEVVNKFGSSLHQHFMLITTNVDIYHYQIKFISN